MILQYIRFIFKTYYKKILWLLICMMMAIGLIYAVIISPNDIQKIYYDEVLPGFDGSLAQMQGVLLNFQIASLLITLPVCVYGFIIVRTFYSQLFHAQLPGIENIFYRGYAKWKIYGIILIQMGILSLIGGILGSLYGNVIYALIIQEAINPLFLQLEVGNLITTILNTISWKNIGIGIGFSLILSSACIMPQILMIKKLGSEDDITQEDTDRKKHYRFSRFLLSNKFSIIVIVISLFLYFYLKLNISYDSIFFDLLLSLSRSLALFIPFSFLWFGIYFLSKIIPKVISGIEKWYLTKVANLKKKQPLNFWRIQFIHQNHIFHPQKFEKGIFIVAISFTLIIFGFLIETSFRDLDNRVNLFEFANGDVLSIQFSSPVPTNIDFYDLVSNLEEEKETIGFDQLGWMYFFPGSADFVINDDWTRHLQAVEINFQYFINHPFPEEWLVNCTWTEVISQIILPNRVLLPYDLQNVAIKGSQIQVPIQLSNGTTFDSSATVIGYYEIYPLLDQCVWRMISNTDYYRIETYDLLYGNLSIPFSVTISSAKLIFAGSYISKMTFLKQMGDYVQSIFPFSMSIGQEIEHIGSYGSSTWGYIPHAYRKGIIQLLSRVLVYFAVLLMVGIFNQISEIEIGQQRPLSFLRSHGASLKDLWWISCQEYGRFFLFGSCIGLLGIFGAQMLIYAQNIHFIEDFLLSERLTRYDFLQYLILDNIGWLFLAIFSGYIIWFVLTIALRIRKTRVQDEFLLRENKILGSKHYGDN